MTDVHSHSHFQAIHPQIVKRLRRADGNLDSVIEMIDGGRSRLDIAQQLRAVGKAIALAPWSKSAASSRFYPRRASRDAASRRLIAAAHG